MTNDWPWYKQLAGHLFMLLLGPIHFGGEIVGPAGGVNTRGIVYGVLGTWLWAMVLGYVYSAVIV